MWNVWWNFFWVKMCCHHLKDSTRRFQVFHSQCVCVCVFTVAFNFFTELFHNYFLQKYLKSLGPNNQAAESVHVRACEKLAPQNTQHVAVYHEQIELTMKSMGKWAQWWWWAYSAQMALKPLVNYGFCICKLESELSRQSRVSERENRIHKAKYENENRMCKDVYKHELPVLLTWWENVTQRRLFAFK